MHKTLLAFIFAGSLLLTSTLCGDDAIEADLGGFDTEEVIMDETGDDLAGFANDESFITQTEEEVVAKEKSMFSLSGNVAFKTSYGYKDHSVFANYNQATGSLSNPVEYSGFNQVQISTYLQLDAKLNDDWKMRISGDAFYDAIYELRTENNYNQATLDAYETQLRFDDVYLAGRLSNDLDLKIGRQIVVWGKSDSIRITDVINPLDNRLPAMTDIEDLRLPTTMAKLDYYLGSWNLSAMLIAENRIFLEAAPRGEFFPVDNIFPGFAPDPFIELVKPDISWENTQYAFAANGVFSGWDLSFYGANVFNSKWHLEGTFPNASREVGKINMLGSAINIALGSWLLKSEIAYLDKIRYNSTQDEKSRLDALVGFDYMGVKDTVLSLEVSQRHIFEYEWQMADLNSGYVPDYVDQNEYQTALRATRSFANDSINATALLSMFGATWEYGGFTRIWVEYDLMDAVVANVGLVEYIGGERPFVDAIKDNDRVFADIRYSF